MDLNREFSYELIQCIENFCGGVVKFHFWDTIEFKSFFFSLVKGLFSNVKVQVDIVYESFDKGQICDVKAHFCDVKSSSCYWLRKLE